MILLSIFAMQVQSQNIVQRASKTMDYRFDDCSVLHIMGEKATIHITGKAQKSVILKITFVARHKNQATALNDIKHIRFSHQKEGSILTIKNFYETSNRKIESNLSVIYELFVPEEIVLQLRNLYGAVTLLNLSGEKSLDISFGRLDMNNTTGSTQLQMRYSSVNAESMSGSVTGTLSKSDATFLNCNAAIDLNTNYGKIYASLSNECETFKIAGNRTEIEILANNPNYNLNLKTSYSKVLLNNNAVGQHHISLNKAFTRTIEISTNYCPIKINFK